MTIATYMQVIGVDLASGDCESAGLWCAFNDPELECDDREFWMLQDCAHRGYNEALPLFEGQDFTIIES